MRYSSKQSLRGYDKAAQGSITPTIAGYVVVSDPRLPHEMKESNDNSDSKLIVTYNVQDASEPTQLYFYMAREGAPFSIRGVDVFDKVEIDSTKVSVVDLDSNSGTYQLSSGEHTIAYTLKDPTSIGIEVDEQTETPTKIGALFIGCASITRAQIPNSVTSIGYNAFAECESLTSITMPDSVTNIVDNAFSDCPSLSSITIDNNNPVYDSRNNCNAIIETNTNTLIRGCNNTVIPNTVTSIGDSAFSSCSSLISLTIPNNVMSIGDNAFGLCTSLTSITIPDSVTNIGEYTFSSCSSLTNITIGSGVTIIGDHTFYGCSSLTNITIPNSVTTISECAFCACSSLASITSNAITAPTISNDTFLNVKTNGTLTVPIGSTGYNTWMLTEDYYLGKYGWIKEELVPNNTIVYTANAKLNKDFTSSNFGTDVVSHTFDNGVGIIECQSDIVKMFLGTFTDCTELTSVIIPDTVTKIGINTFLNCTNLTSFKIPNNVTSIGDSAFSGCSHMTSITIPNSVTSIGNNAFAYCSSLASITIPNSMTSLKGGIFYGCSGLTSVTIPNSVTSIEDAYDHAGSYYGVFSGCTSLASVTIPDSIISIGSEAFKDCTSLTSVVIPNSVTSIGHSIFYGCTSLASVTISDNVTSIKNSAFRNCSSLTSITIPNNVTSIDANVFYGCSGLTSVTIPNGVTKIESSTFSHCEGLTSIVIPNSVTSIVDRAFSYCTSLTSITSLATTAPAIQSGAFQYIKRNGTLTVPQGSTGYNIWMQDENYYLGKYGWTKEEFLPNNMIIYTADAQLDKTFTSDSFGTDVVSHTFSNGTGIIVCQDDITKIGNGAFVTNYTLLNSIKIPNSVTSIGNNAFHSQANLTSITIGSEVTNIGNYVFQGCDRLTSITSLAPTAPTVTDNTFRSVKTDGTLFTPLGSTGYDTWMSTGDYYLGKYNWTKVEQ